MVYYCVFCGKRLNKRKKKYCSNGCKCKQFYKEHPEKCNLWHKKNPKPKVNNKCLICGTPCGRKKYCSEICKPKTIYISPHLKGIARFNTKCYACQKTFILVHIHHKDGNHNNNEKNNLIPLCHLCHSKIHNFSLKSKKINKETLSRLKELKLFLKKKKVI